MVTVDQPWLQWTSSGPGEMSLGIQLKQNCGYSGPTVVTVDQLWLQWTSSGPGEMSLGIQLKQNCGYSGPAVGLVR